MKSHAEYPVRIEIVQVIAEATASVEYPALSAILDGLAKDRLDDTTLAAIAPQLPVAARRLVIDSLVCDGLVDAHGRLTDAGRAARKHRRIPRREQGVYEIYLATGPGLSADGQPIAARRAPEVEGVRFEKASEIAFRDRRTFALEGARVKLIDGSDLVIDRLVPGPGGNVAMRKVKAIAGLGATRLRTIDFGTLNNSHAVLLRLPGPKDTVLTCDLPPLSESEVESILRTATVSTGANSSASGGFAWHPDRRWFGSAMPPAGTNPTGPFVADLQIDCHIPGEIEDIQLTLAKAPVGPNDSKAAEDWFSDLFLRQISGRSTFPAHSEIQRIHQNVANAIPGGIATTDAAFDSRLSKWRRGGPAERHLAFRLEVATDFGDVPGLFA